MANPQASGAELIKSVDQKIEKIRSRPLDLSFNELLDMHKNKELIIDPEYQRLFRWSEGKQSRFIETLLLEMPIPPIYVIEIGDGIYELIDGLQRISSYLHFRGKHPDRKNMVAHCVKTQKEGSIRATFLLSTPVFSTTFAHTLWKYTSAGV